MDLKNGYKVIYEKAAKGERTFYATTTGVCDPTVDEEITKSEIGKYKLIYEKDGHIYGSENGIPAEGDFHFEAFHEVFVEKAEQPEALNTDNSGADDNGNDSGEGNTDNGDAE